MKYYQKGEYDKAQEALSAFAEKHPKESELIDRSRTYLEIIRVRLNPPKIVLKTAEDFYLNGIFLLNLGRYEEALQSLSKAREKSPQEARIPYAMADVCCRRGEHEACLKYLGEAIKADKEFAVLAQNESDFQPLWEDQRFIKITDTE